MKNALMGSALVLMAMPAGNAVAQTDAQNDEARPITLVGCIMRESQYLDMYGPGQSGPRGPGLGLRAHRLLSRDAPRRRRREDRRIRCGRALARRSGGPRSSSRTPALVSEQILVLLFL